MNIKTIQRKMFSNDNRQKLIVDIHFKLVLALDKMVSCFSYLN